MPFPYSFPFSFGDSEPPQTWLKQLLPPGVLWLLEAGSTISNTLIGAADEIGRVYQRGVDLINETDPRTAVETLGDWERVLGLPDAAITTIPTDTPSRQLAITQKVIRQGGQNAAFYIALAAACGYPVTITDNFGATVLRSGFRSGSRCYGAAWAFVWQVNVSPPTGGASLTHAELEAIIRRAAPAHTVVFFHYL